MAALFDQTSGLAAERLQVTLALRGEGGPLGGSMNDLLDLPLETAVLGQVGKAYNMKAQEAREKALAIHHFYWLNVKRVLVSW